MQDGPNKPLNRAQKLLIEIKKENFLCFTDSRNIAPSKSPKTAPVISIKGKDSLDVLTDAHSAIKYRASDKATKVLGLG